MTKSRYSNQELIEAYQKTGSIWSAGKILGLAGQSVHERLRALGHPMAHKKWGDEERSEMFALVDEGLTCAQIAHRLGRTFPAVASQLSLAGVRIQANRQRKLPRGAGYDKVSTLKHLAAIEAGEHLVTRYARANGLGVENLVQALQKYAPERWEAYCRRTSSVPERQCIYCETSFIPASGKQQYCNRACASSARADRNYFDGKRRNTIGLAEGICQLCGRRGVKGLSSHHVFGREHDMETLIALCPGCHKTVGMLGSRNFVDDPEVWEALIQLAWMRKHGPDYAAGKLEGMATYVCVDIEIEADEDGGNDENEVQDQATVPDASAVCGEAP